MFYHNYGTWRIKGRIFFVDYVVDVVANVRTSVLVFVTYVMIWAMDPLLFQASNSISKDEVAIYVFN